MNVYFGPEAAKEIQELAFILDMDERQVIVNAMLFYQHAVREELKGNFIYSVDKDGNLITEYKVTP